MRTIWVKNVIINECGNNSYYFLACYASCVCPSFLLRTRISQDANDLIQVDKLAPQHSNDYRFTTGKHYSIRYCHWSVSVEIVFPSGLFPEYANVTRNIRSFLSRVFYSRNKISLNHSSPDFLRMLIRKHAIDMSTNLARVFTLVAICTMKDN